MQVLGNLAYVRGSSPSRRFLLASSCLLRVMLSRGSPQVLLAPSGSPWTIL